MPMESSYSHSSSLADTTPLFQEKRGTIGNHLYSYSPFHKPVLSPLNYNVDLPCGTQN
jgi:hypothetical protein